MSNATASLTIDDVNQLTITVWVQFAKCDSIHLKGVSHTLNDYKMNAITKAFWSHVSDMLQSTKSLSPSKHAVNDFANQFWKKIDDIHDVTSNAPAVVIEHRSMLSLLTFQPESADEIMRNIMKSPNKQCLLM